MIAMLRGLLVEKSPAEILLDVGGVGYEVLIPLSTYDRLPAPGSECRLLINHIVREDDELLFGFATKAEKDLFRLLTTIRGIGPKLALCVLSGLTAAEFKRCVAEGDIKRLSSVNGIGRKTAERMVVELRDRIDPVEAMALRTPAGAPPAAETVMRDTLLALGQLGFAQDTARKMVQGAVDSGADASNPEALLKRALAGR
jgi:Holliday junction DNA helicase RuvA